MSKSGFDQYISIFSPEGALYQVEYSFKAVRYPGNTSVAVRGKDCVFVLTQRKIPDKLMKVESVTSLYDINHHIGVCVTGRAPDGKALVNRAREEAAEYSYEYGQPIPIQTLAKRMGDIAQVSTQHNGVRPMGVTLTFIGTDQNEETGEYTPKIYKVDPAGFYAGYHALATGAKEVEGFSYLEKKQKNVEFHTLSREEAGKLTLNTLQHITGVSLKAQDIEMAEVRDDQRTFERVKNTEIETWLTALAEKD